MRNYHIIKYESCDEDSKAIWKITNNLLNKKKPQTSYSVVFFQRFSNKFIGIFIIPTAETIVSINLFENLTNNLLKAAHYELTSPIFIIEQYIPLQITF